MGKDGTQFCDVTVTLLLQEKNVNAFFPKLENQ